MSDTKTKLSPSAPASTPSGFEDTVVDFDSLFIRSVYPDYRDVPVDIFTSAPAMASTSVFDNTDVQISAHLGEKIVIPSTKEVDISETTDTITSAGSVISIELLNWPPARYTLNINGLNCGSTTNNKFNIFQMNNNMMESLRMVSEQYMQDMMEPCMCNIGDDDIKLVYSRPPKSCLHLSAFDNIRICAPKGVTLPKGRKIRLTGYDRVLFPEGSTPEYHLHTWDISLHRYYLNTGGITPYMVLNVEPGSYYDLHINDQKVLHVETPPESTFNYLVIRFECPMIEGLENHYISRKDTINLSRVDHMYISTDGPAPSVTQCQLVTWAMPGVPGVPGKTNHLLARRYICR